MPTSQPTLANAERLRQQWQFEDHELAARIDGVRRWMKQVAERGTPRFGELGSQLIQVRSNLISHFGREQAISDQLVELGGERNQDAEAIRHQLSLNHQQLLGKLNELIAKLNLLEPPFASWQAAMDELQTFSDAFREHEEQQSSRYR